MSLSTAFEGDPESCWLTARRLHRLAGAVADARSFAATQAGVSPDVFDGWAADAYRLSAGRLGDRARGCRSACRALAVALEDFGTDLDAVRLALHRTRGVARRHLVVRGEEVLHPGPYADDLQRQVFGLVEHAVHDARRLEHQAHRDWQRALAEHAGTPAVPPAGLPAPAPGGAPAGPPPQVAPGLPPRPAERPAAATSPQPPAPPGAAPLTAGVLTVARRAPEPVDLDLVLVSPDDWAPAINGAINGAISGAIPWEVPDGPR